MRSQLGTAERSGSADSTVRLGFLIPSANTVVERDVQRSFPPEVTTHFARMALTLDDAEQLAALAASAPGAAELLAHAKVAAIAFTCTTGSLHGGLGYDRDLIAAIEQATGIPTTTTATAVVDALHAVGASRVALVSPYEPWLNDKVVDFLAANEIGIDGVFGFAIADPIDTAAIPPSAIAAAVLSTVGDRTDSVLISCTAFRGREALELLRRKLAIPAISSNQATFWKLAVMAGTSTIE